MQVPQPSLQHEVMIEAVENHMPEVIVIDEIGRELEAQAARTIAERGVQLIGTAHGNTLDNLLLNPDAVRPDRRHRKRDALRRRSAAARHAKDGARAPRAADLRCADRNSGSAATLIVHHDVATSVDNLLRGRPPETELRYRDEQGHMQRVSGSNRQRRRMRAAARSGPDLLERGPLLTRRHDPIMEPEERSGVSEAGDDSGRHTAWIDEAPQGLCLWAGAQQSWKKPRSVCACR